MMAFDDLRSFLQALDDHGQLLENQRRNER